MSDYKVLLAAESEGVLTVTLNRPDRLNALTDELMTALLGAFTSAARSASVRCVVLTGAGSGFCAGQDLTSGPAGWSRSGDHMRFTRASAWRACAPSFPAADLDVQGHGNVRSVTAFLYGLAAEELDPAELSHRDPNIDFVIVVRALRRT